MAAKRSDRPMHETPANRGFHGGGGSRTRELFRPPLSRPPAYLREMTEAAWRTSRPFALAFEHRLWVDSKAVVGTFSETRLYAICELDGSAWKFGLAGNPQSRLANLQIGNSRQLLVYAHAPATIWFERLIHRVLRRQRIGGEWFAAAPRTLTIAHLIQSAEEQTYDLEECGEAADSDDTIAALCYLLAEAEVAA